MDAAWLTLEVESLHSSLVVDWVAVGGQFFFHLTQKEQMQKFLFPISKYFPAVFPTEPEPGPASESEPVSSTAHNDGVLIYIFCARCPACWVDLNHATVSKRIVGALVFFDHLRIHLVGGCPINEAAMRWF